MIFDPATHAGDLLSAHLDGELAPETAAKVETHLAACPECRAELDHVGATRAALRSSPAVPAPAGFTRELVRTRHRSSRRGVGVALVAASVAVVAGLALAPVHPDTAEDHPDLALNAPTHAEARITTGPTTTLVPFLGGDRRDVPVPGAAAEAEDDDDDGQSLGERVGDAVGALLDAIGG